MMLKMSVNSRFVIDLGRESLDLYDDIKSYFKHMDDEDFSDNDESISDLIHMTIIDDLIGFLNIPLLEAMDKIKNLHDFSFHIEILGLYRPKENDHLYDIVRKRVFNIYMRMRYQVMMKPHTRYVAKMIKLDHALIEEVNVESLSRGDSTRSLEDRYAQWNDDDWK